MFPTWLDDLKQRIAGAFDDPASVTIDATHRNDAPPHWELEISPAGEARLLLDLLALTKLLDKMHVMAVDGGDPMGAAEVRLLGHHQGDRVAVRVFLAGPADAS